MALKRSEIKQLFSIRIIIIQLFYTGNENLVRADHRNTSKGRKFISSADILCANRLLYQ